VTFPREVIYVDFIVKDLDLRDIVNRKTYTHKLDIDNTDTDALAAFAR